MKERPILFSGPMVRAILDGRKTQTRRAVKTPIWTGRDDPNPAAPNRYGDVATIKPCPYGQPGDRLWVRETFAPLVGGPFAPDNPIMYKATVEKPEIWSWKPSIFMPRWASRITLEITGIRIQRVQEISCDDCRAEGCGTEEIPWCGDGYTRHPWVDTYRRLWNDINADSWGDNPWVWVIEFRQIQNAQADL